MARVGTDDQQCVGSFDAFNGCVEQISGPPVPWMQHGAILAAVIIRRADGLHQALQRKQIFNACQITADGADMLWRIGLDTVGDQRKSLLPAGRAQFAAFAQIRPVEPLCRQTIPDESGLVGNPFLVHRLIEPRHDAHHFAATGIDPDGRTNRIHDVNSLGLGQFPGPRLESVWLGGQRADRTQINHVALQF